MKQADTARAVYHNDIKPTLHGRQLFVRQQLEAFILEYRQPPTGLELVRYVASKFPQRQIDVNTIRPRCFELEQQGWVKHGEKRRCVVSGKRVYTWELSTPTPPRQEELHQASMF